MVNIESIIKNFVTETKIASFLRGVLFKYVGGVLTGLGVSVATANSFAESLVLTLTGIIWYFIGQFFSNKAKE